MQTKWAVVKLDMQKYICDEIVKMLLALLSPCTHVSPRVVEQIKLYSLVSEAPIQTLMVVYVINLFSRRSRHQSIKPNLRWIEVQF